MARPELTPRLALLEEAVSVLFCQVDDAYYRLNPDGRRYETLKELSDSDRMHINYKRPQEVAVCSESNYHF